MESREGGDGPLLAPDLRDLGPSPADEAVAWQTPPGERARVSVHGADIHRICSGQPRDVSDLAQQIWPSEAAMSVADDDEVRLTLARPIGVDVVPGGVVHVAGDVSQPIVPSRIARAHEVDSVRAHH